MGVNGQILYCLRAKQLQVGGIIGDGLWTSAATDMLIQAEHPVSGRHHHV
jgi:hypothetical protein